LTTRPIGRSNDSDRIEKKGRYEKKKSKEYILRVGKIGVGSGNKTLLVAVTSSLWKTPSPVELIDKAYPNVGIESGENKAARDMTRRLKKMKQVHGNHNH